MRIKIRRLSLRLHAPWIAALFCTILYMNYKCSNLAENKSQHVILHKLDKCPRIESFRKIDMDGDTDIVINGTTEPWNSYFDKDLVWCNATKRHLHGRMNISVDVKAKDYNAHINFADIKYGGIYRPRDCKQEDSVAIVIPYRDRAKHLKTLVKHLHAMLQRQKLYYGIYVVEMALPVQFNRGLLANAGFMTAESVGNYSCYIIHDVDLLPLNDFNEYKCSPTSPIHLVTKSSKFKTSGLPYEDYIGGVLALTREQYLRVNGFSNLYFGWGGEDDDMLKRIKAKKYGMERVAKHIGVYLALPHKGDRSNPRNPYKDQLLQLGALRMEGEGLSSISFSRKSLEFRHLYTWMLINCVESEIMGSYGTLRISGSKAHKQSPNSRRHFLNDSTLHKLSRYEINNINNNNLSHSYVDISDKHYLRGSNASQSGTYANIPGILVNRDLVRRQRSSYSGNEN